MKIHIIKESYKDLVDGKPADFSPFRPGMSCTVEIQTESVSNALTLPIQAVTTRIAKDSLDKINQNTKTKKEDGDREVEMVSTAKKSDKIQECVFILRDGIAKKADVKTGIQDNTYIQIISGLKDGDEVITAPYSAVSKLLKDGDKVKKVDKKDLFSKEKEK
ncbi:MAG: hypothetical protein ACOYNU_09425 [Bacteroidales bacterium]